MTGQVGPLSAFEATFAEHFTDVRLDEVAAAHDAMGGAVGLVVGMAPGPYTNARLPMFPWPEGSAGGRLLAMSGMPMAQYLGRLRRVNVCLTVYRRDEARQTAKRLLLHYQGTGARFVLCGRRVAEAFGMSDSAWFARRAMRGWEAVVIPHPSGRCREYSDPAAVAGAREAVRWAAWMP